jgi:hypothetical protein
VSGNNDPGNVGSVRVGRGKILLQPGQLGVGDIRDIGGMLSVKTNKVNQSHIHGPKIIALHVLGVVVGNNRHLEAILVTLEVQVVLDSNLMISRNGLRGRNSENRENKVRRQTKGLRTM